MELLCVIRMQKICAGLTIRAARAMMKLRGEEMKDKELLKLLKQHGWQEKSINGSHHKLVKDGKTIVVPVHGKELTKGMQNAILKQAGLK